MPPDFRVFSPDETVSTPEPRLATTQQMPRAFLKLGELPQAGLFRVGQSSRRRSPI